MKLLVIFMFLVLALTYLSRCKKEEENWNGGECKCGGKWILISIDHNGCRNYMCSKCSNYLPIIGSADATRKVK